MSINTKSHLITARHDIERAKEALRNSDRQAAWNDIHKACLALTSSLDLSENKALFVTASIELSKLGFALGKDLYQITIFLSKALDEANLIGDRRSRALINLHLGMLYYFGQRRFDAMEAFEKGLAEVKELGDEDIGACSAEFIGIYYFTQGLFKKAYKYFERVLERIESYENDLSANMLTPLWMGYCAAFMGRFHHAIGTLDYYYRFCLDRGDRSSASAFRAALGIILLMAQKKNEAFFHLSGALQEAKDCNNRIALYLAQGGLVYHLFSEGDIEKAYKAGQNMSKMPYFAGLNGQFISPEFLEMFFAYHRHRFIPISGSNIQSEVSRILQEPNLFLRGVALRLRAMDTMATGGKLSNAEQDLDQSEKYLTQSGGVIQLAKTLIEKARLKLKEGNEREARVLVRRACKEQGGYKKDFFPDDLRYLLRVKSDLDSGGNAGEELLERFMDIIKVLEPTTDVEIMLHRTIKATNRLFGAERGGIIWFERGSKKQPILRAAHNLKKSDLRAEDFRSNMALVYKAYRTKQPQIIKADEADPWTYPCRSILCLPFKAQGNTWGVLYHDNSYIDGCFDLFDIKYLNQMAQIMGQYIERLYSHSVRIEEIATRKMMATTLTDFPEIITQSPVMNNILEKSDKISMTKSTVVILGETGTGKELFARRIHEKSQRADKPFIIVDPTTTPESLFESELFGYEKGAFTGADRQKKGRLELAHSGTLFIDEVGDIPLSVQVKLLRVLQEKTIVRVGGTKTIFSDFRLVAATNRDLTKMVASGSFREDLYYRINVVPIKIPPLRDRIEDIPLLAEYFLNRYIMKYHNPFQLTVEDESRLKSYHWPGNVRELQNIMERAVLLSTKDNLELNLPTGKNTYQNNPFEDLPTMEEMQRRYIKYVLKKTDGKQSGPNSASEILGMKRTTLFNRMKKLGIKI